MNWLDLAIIVFAIILIAIGIKRGFMSSVISHFSLSLNLLLSVFFYKPVQWCLNKWFGIGNAIANHYSKDLLEASSDFGINLLTIEKGNLHSFVEETMDKSGLAKLPRFFYDVFMNNSSLYSKLHDSGLKSRTLAEIVSESLSSFFTTIIAFAIAFLLLTIIILLFKLLIDQLRKIGFVKAVDGILGALYGLFQCFIILIIICLVLKLMSPFSFMTSVTNYINDSLLGKLIYGPINDLISNYLNFGEIIRQIF